MNSRIIKQLSIIFLLIALAAVLTACGEDRQDNGGISSEVVSGEFTYFDTGDGICIVDYSGSDPVVHIPETLDGKTVTQLQMNTHDIIREIFIPATVKVVHGFTRSAGLEIVHWEGVESTESLFGLSLCYDIKELYLPGMASIHLCDLQQNFYRRLTVLDISDCVRVTGYMAPSSYEDGLSLKVKVNEDIHYLRRPENVNDCITLSSTFEEGALSITEETWEEAWSYIFIDYAELELNGKTLSTGTDHYSAWTSTSWWQGIGADGQPNGKLFHITENHSFYVGDESTADMKKPEETMTEFYDTDFLLYYGGQLWDLQEGFAYQPMVEGELVTLPDGTQIAAYKITYLDDGTIVIPYRVKPAIMGHKSYFADGTTALSHYCNSSGTVCEYKDAYTIWVDWYRTDGLLWKEDYYQAENMLLLQQYAYEYETIVQDAGSATYAIATVSLFYDENTGRYYKSRSEYNPVYGSSKPDKTYTYDYETGAVTGWAEYEYDMYGTTKWVKHYNGNNILIQHDGYTDGKLTIQYLFDEETGEKTREFLYEDYENNLILKDAQFYRDGSIYTAFYSNGIRFQSEWVHSDKSYQTTLYDENENATVTNYYTKGGKYTGQTKYEYSENGLCSKDYYYNKSGVLEYMNEYTGSETGEYIITTWYYKNGKIDGIQAVDIDHNVIRSEKYDEKGNLLWSERYDENGNIIG